MAALLGPVLTNAKNIDRFLDYYRAGRFTTAKVVAGWGLDTGWTDEARRKLVASVPNLIVRTTVGDPSNPGTYWFPHPDVAEAEVSPWLTLKPDLFIEIGNEPSVVWEQQGRDEYLTWVYRWWLDETIQRLRNRFPRARLVAPSPCIGVPGWERWLEIPSDVIHKCDAVSLHLYGWHRIVGDGKGEYAAAIPMYRRLFLDKPILVTEVGIHHPPMPKSEKLALYREFARTAPANIKAVLFYHYNERGDIHPEYAIPASVVGL